MVYIAFLLLFLSRGTTHKKKPRVIDSDDRITKNSLRDVFNNMNDDGDYYYARDKWVIHDPSKITKIGNVVSVSG